MEIIITILLILLVIFIIFSGYFSGLETAYVSLSTLKIKQMLEENIKGADLLYQLKHDQQKVVMTILICNNIVNIGASSITTYLVMEFFGSGYVAIATGILTLIILIFGEITPKVKAGVKYVEIAKKNSRIMLLLLAFFAPVLRVLDFLTGIILKIFGMDSTKRPEDHITEEVVKRIVSISEKEGSINETEKKMIHKIFDFDDTLVKNIMTPRVSITAIDLNTDIKENLSIIVNSGFSRIPVYNRKIDKIIGILFTKDLLKFIEINNNNISKSDFKNILRPPYFVPEHMKIDALFNEFRMKKTHIAIIIDEYGVVMGLVTLEDLVEEVFGEIYDETDNFIPDFQKISSKEYIFRGVSKIEDVNRETKLDLKSSNSDTISGFILERLERMPGKNETLIFDNFSIKVLKTKDNRIELIRIELKGSESKVDEKAKKKR